MVRGRGAFDPSDPHISFSQLSYLARCPAKYKAVYQSGTASEQSPWLQDGKATHACLYGINVMAKGSPDGISLDMVDPLIDKMAGEFSSYEWFKKMAEKLRIYSEKANGDRKELFLLEQEVRWVYEVNGKKVTLLGVIDRFDKVNSREWSINEFKMVGQIPSKEELEDDLQTTLYNLCVRFGEYKDVDGEWQKFPFPNGSTGWKVWRSIFHNISIRAKADAESAVQVQAFVKGKTEELMRMIDEDDFPEKTGVWCVGCPVAANCASWTRLRQGAGSAAVVPTLGEFVGYRGNESAIKKTKDEIAEAIKARLEAMPEGLLLEDGYIATLKVSQGGLSEDNQRLLSVPKPLPEDDLDTYADRVSEWRDEIAEKMERQPGTKLDVRVNRAPAQPAARTPRRRASNANNSNNRGG